MTERVDRLYNDTDDGSCRRCGECCIVLTLESISMDEAEKLGMEFCYPAPKYPGRYGIKRVHRSWEPPYAYAGVCVFLHPGEHGFRCMARGERPLICSVFKCVSTVWAAQIDWKVLNDKLWSDRESLDPDVLAEREAELAAARKKRDEFREFRKAHRMRTSLPHLDGGKHASSH